LDPPNPFRYSYVSVTANWVTGIVDGLLVGEGVYVADGEGSFVLDIDVLVLSVPLDGFLQTFEALHGRKCRRLIA